MFLIIVAFSQFRSYKEYSFVHLFHFINNVHFTGISASVLNARPENVERESEVVAQAGRLGAVTVATNMAGRGTDILLGGSSKGIAKVPLIFDVHMIT